MLNFYGIFAVVYWFDFENFLKKELDSDILC